MTTLEQVHDFVRFAKAQLAGNGQRSIDDLYKEWRQRAFKEQDPLAVHASLRDLEHGGRGRPVEEFLAVYDKGRRESRE